MPAVRMNTLWLKRLLAPETGQVDYFDQKQSGLGLRVGKSGVKTWFVMYRIKGDRKKRRLTLDRYPHMPLAKAREEARKVLVKADSGRDPAQEKQQEKGRPSFPEFAAEYLDKHAKHKRSVYEDRRIIEKDLLPAWRLRKAHDIRRLDVIRLLDTIVERGAPIQANRTLALIRKMYNWGIGRDLVQHNPCTQVKSPSRENQRDRVLSQEEIRSVWEAFDKLGSIMGGMFKLRLLTAQRGGEVQSIRWEDLDLSAGWWTIPPERSKNRLSHRVPLSELTLTILRELKEITGNTEWVFPSPIHKCGHISNVQKAALRVKEYSGVEDFKPHDLRRTAASLMTSMGISRLVVSKILNHVERGVTSVYDRHSYDHEKRVALDKWSWQIEQILEQGKADIIPMNLKRVL